MRPNEVGGALARPLDSIAVAGWSPGSIRHWRIIQATSFEERHQ